MVTTQQDRPRWSGRYIATAWRIAMDEIEYRSAYNAAVTAAEHITAPETKTAVMLVLQLLNGLNERIIEMQSTEDDEDED